MTIWGLVTLTTDWMTIQFCQLTRGRWTSSQLTIPGFQWVLCHTNIIIIIVINESSYNDKYCSYVRPFGSVVMLSTDREIPGSFSGSAVWVLASGESFHGMYGLDVTVDFVYFLSCVVSGEGPCTLLTTGQRRPSNGMRAATFGP